MECNDVLSIHIYDVMIKMILLRRAFCRLARTFSTFVNLSGYVSWWVRGGRRYTHGRFRDHWIRTTILDEKLSREFTWWLRAHFWLPDVKNLGAQFRRSCTKGVYISLYFIVALQSHVHMVRTSVLFPHVGIFVARLRVRCTTSRRRRCVMVVVYHRCSPNETTSVRVSCNLR